MKVNIVCFLIFPFLLLNHETRAQKNKFQSIFIYNFSKYVQWPDSQSQGDFVIGVLGQTDLEEELKKISQIKKIGVRSIKVKHFDSPSKIEYCHMLFISDDSSNDLPVVLERLSNDPVLVMTERQGLATQGSMINFVNVDGRWKFELNQSAAQKANLMVSNELSRLAILI